MCGTVGACVGLWVHVWDCECMCGTVGACVGLWVHACVVCLCMYRIRRIIGESKLVQKTF